MSSNLQNSIWPNTDGNLGNIKVQIPDGVTTTWPTGDALVHNFVFNKGKLVGFVDTKALIANTSKTTTFPYDYVNISLPSISEGQMTYNHDQCAYFILNGKVIKGDISSDDDLEEINFKYMGCKTVDEIKAVDPNYKTTDINADGEWFEKLDDLTDGNNMFSDCSNLTTFTSDLPNLTNGTSMFSACYNLIAFSSEMPSLENGYCMFYKSNLSQFTSDLPRLTDAYSMFKQCYNLTSFSSDLSSLTDGAAMFYECTNLTSFSSDLSSLTDGYSMLPSLTNGTNMFTYCTNLATFSSVLPSLQYGSSMFHSCTNLTTFTSDLSSLTVGEYMFYGCRSLTSFSSGLSSLTDGQEMFRYCKLDTASVQHIANTINTVTGSPKIDIGIDKSSPNEQEKEAFNKMVDKGWRVYVNGISSDAGCFASLTTLDETGQEITTPIPFWAKPVPSDEQHAHYIDSEGNFYNILGAQFIYGDNLETYGMFTSLEDAQTQMGLKKIGEEEIETA